MYLFYLFIYLFTYICISKFNTCRVSRSSPGCRDPPQEFSASTNADALLACQPVAITRPWMEAQVTAMKSLVVGKRTMA